MKTKVTCPHCQTQFEADVQVRETNRFGFTTGSKGAVISELIEKRGKVSMMDILNELEKQFAGENNTARVQQVLYQMKRNGFIYTEGTSVMLVTPGTAKAVAPKAPKAADPKVQHLDQKK